MGTKVGGRAGAGACALLELVLVQVLVCPAREGIGLTDVKMYLKNC